MKLVLPNVISESQAGFLKGRFIGETTRIIYDVLDYCKTNNIPGLLLTIDFEKAFDTIDWDFIDKTLQSFNFGQSLRKWVKLFFNDSSSANLNFGYLSPFLRVSGDVDKGTPFLHTCLFYVSNYCLLP